MRISRITPLPLHTGRDTLVVKVETECGLYGLGEAGCSTRELAEAAVVEHYARFLVGQDPRRIEHLWQLCYRSNYHEGGRVLTGAMSAIDIALWDILGKHLGVPVYQLLGGACRDVVYGFSTTRSVADPGCLAQCRELIAAGWPCLRLGPASGVPDWAAARHAADPAADSLYDPRTAIARTVEHFTAIAAELDPAVPLGIDFHHRLSIAEAASLCQQLPPGRLAWLEEPIRNETPEAYAMLRQMTNVPFAIGEEWSSKWQARPYIEQGLTNLCRLDVCNIGGLSEARKVANWCEAHYIDIMPHNPLGPVCTAATIQLCFAVNNLAWPEIIPGINEAPASLFPVQLPREGPCFPLPTRPGLGVELDESGLDAAVYQHREMPHFHKPDGSVTNW